MITCGPNAWLVAGGSHGLGSSFDCSVYALECGNGLIVFDAGSGLESEKLISALTGLCKGRPILALILTHAHADHSAGAAALKAHFGMPVLAGAATSRIVETADEVAMSLDRARCSGIYPADFRFTPCAIDLHIADGEHLVYGTVAVTAVATPGHSADHTSYLVKRDNWGALIAGDALFDGGCVVLQDTWDCSVPDTCASIRKLAKLNFDAFLPAHGPVSLAGGSEQVSKALRRIDRLLVPELFC
jgi:glyoxylase-like metal-dependent hydrolase (beta-lactamase superfamily II)